MQRQVIIAGESAAPTGTLSNQNIYSTVYADDGTGLGYYRPAYYSDYSEGMATENPTNAPAWGTWQMFSDGVVGVDFQEQWWMNSSFSPTSYSLVSGAMPDGLALSTPTANQGQISGVPTVAGTFNFTLRATNDYGTDDKAFEIIVVVAAGGGGSYTFLA